MKILGFNLLKGEIRFSLLDGLKNDPKIINKGKYSVIKEEGPILMNWFETTFNSIIERMEPEKIAYRIALNPTKSQFSYLIFPYAILNLIAYQMKMGIHEYSLLNFKPSKLSLPKDINLYTHCDQVFGICSPYWDKNQKNSILAAWLTLPE